MRTPEGIFRENHAVVFLLSSDNTRYSVLRGGEKTAVLTHYGGNPYS